MDSSGASPTQNDMNKKTPQEFLGCFFAFVQNYEQEVTSNNVATSPA